MPIVIIVLILDHSIYLVCREGVSARDSQTQLRMNAERAIIYILE